jgi:hypothetical protein
MARHRFLGRLALPFALSAIAVSPVNAIHSGATTTKNSPYGVLEVRVLGIKSGVPAEVTVRGPKFRHVIGKSTTFQKVLPGTYSLKLAKTSSSSGTEFPLPSVSVKVVKGKAAIANANYLFVPKTTVTVPTSATTSVTGSNSGTQILTITDPTSPIATDEILASGPTTDRPDGYLVKVTHISTSGSTSIVTAEPATLAQALPDGSINLDALFSSLESVVSSNVSSNIRAQDSLSPRSVGSVGLSCSDGESVSVTPSLNFDFTGANANVNWSLSNTTANVSVDYSVASTLSISSQAQASCNANIPLIQVEGPPIVIDAGIPIELNGTFSSALTGTVSIGGALDQSLSATLNVGMSAGLPPSFSSTVFPESPAVTIGDSFASNIDLGVTANIGIEFYGGAGLSLDVGPALNFTVSPAATPWWKLQGCITGGFTANFLDVTLINESAALNWCAPIAEATFGALRPFVPYVSTGPAGFSTVATSPSSCPTPSVGDSMYLIAMTPGYGTTEVAEVQEQVDSSGPTTSMFGIYDDEGAGNYEATITCREGPSSQPSGPTTTSGQESTFLRSLKTVATFPPLTLTATSGPIEASATPSTVSAGQTVTLTATFPPGDGTGIATAYWQGEVGGPSTVEGNPVPVASNGNVSATVQIPSTIAPGKYALSVFATYDSESWSVSVPFVEVNVTN